MEIRSPITGSNNVILEREISSSFIIERYNRELDIDVSRFFKSTGKILIYKCLDTGYRFYHPLNVIGDDMFYRQLEKFPWYYMDWKWEHGIAEKFIKKGDKILEIGCARGAFLKKIKGDGSRAEGLEMNLDALKDCKKRGLDVYPDSIEKFSSNRGNFYDAVCSFQVLEHVPDVKSFIASSLTILKPGGYMIVSVPNNDSVVCRDQNGILNMPPHHMGLWNMNSLIKLQNYFNMSLDSIYLEPLQKYHLGFANKTARKTVEEKLRQKLGPFGSILKSTAERFAFLGIAGIAEFVIGHSILVVFKKNDK